MSGILGSFLRLHACQDTAARLLFATPSGDRHEIGTLGAALLAASSGLGVAYLGPDLPARDILDSVKPAGAQILVLGLTTARAARATETELRAIVRGLPKDVELWIGGPAAARHAATIGNRGLVLRDYDAYQKELVRIGDTFNIRDILFPLTAAGTGQADGLEFSAEKRFTGAWYGQANLAFSRTRQAGLDAVRRPGSFDYPAVINVSGGYNVNPRWDVSMRLSYLSGRPCTPFDLEQSTAQRRGVYDVTLVNTARLPDYVRLDMRVDRRFVVGGRPLLVFAGAQNITNRQNIAGYTWNRAVNAIEVNTQPGLFPIVGLEWRF